MFVCIERYVAIRMSKLTTTREERGQAIAQLSGQVKRLEKTMRGLQNNNTPIPTGYQLFHNYIRPHSALDGKTPSEACGITVEGQNKWLTPIQNASQKVDFLNPKTEHYSKKQGAKLIAL
jgi:hypothetical protein